jgi:hypothetical protein
MEEGEAVSERASGTAARRLPLVTLRSRLPETGAALR